MSAKAIGPLTGILFVVLAIVAALVGGETPEHGRFSRGDRRLLPRQRRCPVDGFGSARPGLRGVDLRSDSPSATRRMSCRPRPSSRSMRSTATCSSPPRWGTRCSTWPSPSRSSVTGPPARARLAGVGARHRRPDAARVLRLRGHRHRARVGERRAGHAGRATAESSSRPDPEPGLACFRSIGGPKRPRPELLGCLPDAASRDQSVEKRKRPARAREGDRPLRLLRGLDQG
jgi:hypothetical protein